MTWLNLTVIMLNEGSQIDIKVYMAFKNRQVVEVRIVVIFGKGID